MCADASAMAIGRPHGRAAMPPLGAAEGGLVAEHTVAAVPHQESTLQKWSSGGPGGMKRSRHKIPNDDLRLHLLLLVII